MKYLFSFSFVFLLSQFGSCSEKLTPNTVMVFETYQDFLDSNGTNIGTLIGHGVTPQLKILKDSSESWVSVRTKWGFKINNVLFRVQGNTYFFVKDYAEVVYYENIYTAFSPNMFYSVMNANGSKSSQDREYSSIYQLCLYSENLGSQIITAPKIDKLAKNNPNLEQLCDCIQEAKHRPYTKEHRGKNTDWVFIKGNRDCIELSKERMKESD